VLVMSVLVLLVRDAYGVREQAAFPCPPETSAAVQAATGCTMVPRDDDDFWGSQPLR
jgi:hypothetical protein